MMKTARLLLAAAIAAFATPAQAVDGVYVADASQVRWIIDGGRLYFRNFEQFDASWKPCCYSFWIDVTTDSGKASLSAFLTAYASHTPMSFYVDSKTAGGPVTFLGRT